MLASHSLRSIEKSRLESISGSNRAILSTFIRNIETLATLPLGALLSEAVEDDFRRVGRVTTIATRVHSSRLLSRYPLSSNELALTEEQPARRLEDLREEGANIAERLQHAGPICFVQGPTTEDDLFQFGARLYDCFITAKYDDSRPALWKDFNRHVYWPTA